MYVDPGPILEVGELADLVDVENRPGRNLVLEQLGFCFHTVGVSEPPGGQGVGLYKSVQGVSGRHFLEEGIFVDQPAELGFLTLKAKAYIIPELVGLAADHHVAVFTGVPGILVEACIPAAGTGLYTCIETIPGMSEAGN